MPSTRPPRTACSAPGGVACRSRRPTGGSIGRERRFHPSPRPTATCSCGPPFERIELMAMVRVTCSLLVLLTASVLGADWPHYGGGPDQMRYSPLTQISRENVGTLQRAWTYDTGDAFQGSEMQCQPVVAHGVLYATSLKLRVFALNAATGAALWSFDTAQDDKSRTRTRIRGLMYWERGNERRVYFAARHWLYALDAKTGKRLDGFG